ncbi:UDPglucose 6-dehydrogenase [Paenibacillus sp. UNCCL117]|uniref:UDP-glucose dehydrogenase family protein n=1 Tax=unclassified Paenibacillus TaxID=185978 RepID=UPI00088FD139|nr:MULTISPECIES: UDP-glucose/GDP-mannose dehydrogenase family protein [unclassified Paenibacillus]SDC02673.1 UDPglucose 6-dehydrogenase [Paenibacillus sp. cl123]SFW36898.1 UDPglucose 6-dehydrogenase [Paenibacillus sp. UNCCL117]
MNVSVIGTGYVGLTTGISLAYLGHQVTCVDIDERKIEGLKAGVLPIYEPGLDELLKESEERIRFTTSYETAVSEAEVLIFAVGTPANDDGSPNLTYLFGAADEVMTHLVDKDTPTVLVNKSTVPVGTADYIAEKIKAFGLRDKAVIASNPEFLRQSRAVSDTLYPERIVVGGDEEAVRTLREMYEGLVSQTFRAPAFAPRPEGLTAVPFLAIDLRSAELAKYAANAFLAMKISFINEIANVCDAVGADVRRVADVIGGDARIGKAFLHAGIGYGGSCFPKDTRALHHIADTNGYDFKLLAAVIEVNGAQKFKLIEKARESLGTLYGKKIAVLGLTFKPGTDDIREAPSLPIIQALIAEGAEVRVHDPIALGKSRHYLPAEARACESVREALLDAEAALLVTEWPEYAEIGPDNLKAWMARPLWIDGRNAFADRYSEEMEYRGVGIRGGASREPVHVHL